MKQLSPTLKHFTVRVGEDMKVLERPKSSNCDAFIACPHYLQLEKLK